MGDSYTKTLIKSEAMVSLFGFLSKPISLANSFIVLGLLSLNDFGIYKLVLSFYAIVSGFSIDFLDNLLLNEMNIYHGEKNHPKAKKIFKEYVIFKILFGFILTLAIFFSAEAVSKRYGSDLELWIKIISLLFVIDNLKSLLIILFQYRLNFLLSTFHTFAIEAIKLIFVLILAYYSFVSITTVLAITVVTNVVVVFFMFLLMFKTKPRELEESLSLNNGEKVGFLLPTLIKHYGKWAVGRYYLLNFSQNVRPWLIKYFLNNEAVAIFSVALDFTGNLKGLISLDSLKVFIPRELQNEDRLKKIFIRGSKYMTFVYSALYIIGAVIVTLAINLLIPKYSPSLPYYFITSASILHFGIYTIAGRIIYSLRRQKELFFFPLFNILSIIVFSAVLIPSIGLYGVAIEFFITQVINSALTYWLLVKYKPNLRLNWRELFTFDDYDKTMIAKGLSTMRQKLRKPVGISGLK